MALLPVPRCNTPLCALRQDAWVSPSAPAALVTTLKRAAHETPQQYLGQGRCSPSPDERDAALLISAYRRVRSEDDAERPEHREQVVRAWERLERRLVDPAREGRSSRHPQLTG